LISGSSVDSAFGAESATGSVSEASVGIGAEDAVEGLETMIRCLHTRHLKRAASPLIFEGSIRYFLPHSSQMTIMVALLKKDVELERWAGDCLPLNKNRPVFAVSDSHCFV
jgi:hypothetical protein